MRKGKRIISLVLSCALVLTMFTGCGTKKNDSKEETKKEDVATDTTGEKTKIRWAVWDVAATPYYQVLIDAYVAKNPNVGVELVDLGSQEYTTVLATQLAGNDTNLDVVTMKDLPGYTNLAAKNVLEPIDTSSLDLSVYGGITDQIKVNDQLYALPFRNDFWVMYYNKDIFDAAGVDYPTNDMTFEQYDELARKVTKTDLGNEVYGSHYHSWRSTVELFGILDGKHTFIDGNYDFLKPYYEIVLQQQKDGVCQDYATIKTSSSHYSGAFAQGNVAMMNMGSWFVPTLIEKIKTGEYSDISNWGLVKYPHPEGVEPGSTAVIMTSLAVASASKNKEAATDFMNFVCGTEGAEVLASTGNFPAIITDDIIETISGREGFPEDANSAEALRTANIYLEIPISDKSGEIDVILNDGHDYIMTETMTIDEGIAYMNEEVGKILNK
nr:sugar ABC transporter substrate-binding protein [uncultured Anaerosporobacter sp.]